MENEAHLVLIFAIVREVEVLLWKHNVFRDFRFFTALPLLHELEFELKWSLAVVRFEDNHHDATFFLSLRKLFKLFVLLFLLSLFFRFLSLLFFSSSSSCVIHRASPPAKTTSSHTWTHHWPIKHSHKIIFTIAITKSE